MAEQNVEKITVSLTGNGATINLKGTFDEGSYNHVISYSFASGSPENNPVLKAFNNRKAYDARLGDPDDVKSLPGAEEMREQTRALAEKSEIEALTSLRDMVERAIITAQQRYERITEFIDVGE